MVKNSCIFYLVNNSPIHLNRLYNSLDCLCKNFKNAYPYPVVFGHEGLNRDVIEKIKIHCPGDIYFHKLNFTAPDYPQEIKLQIPERFKGHWDDNAFFSMGYRHMCRYFSGEIFKDQYFENVKYMLRLDCDSYFINKVSFDIFEKMSRAGAYYGYVGEEEDMDYVIDGLYDFTNKYFKTEANNHIKYNGMYQTHFELVDFQWFKNSEYINFYNEIDKTGNIFIKRWGDAPIKYQGVKNLLTPEETLQFDLPYKHGGDL